MLNFHICSPDHQCAKNEVAAINDYNQSTVLAVGTQIKFQVVDGSYKSVIRIPVQFLG